jgi:hypothetical protein
MKRRALVLLATVILFSSLAGAQEREPSEAMLARTPPMG